MTHLPDAAAATRPEPEVAHKRIGVLDVARGTPARTVFGDSRRTGANVSRLMEHQRLIGRCAWVAAWVGLVAGQLHALSRFATDAGAEDLALPATAAWAVPAAKALSPLLGWGDPDLVYLTYGKIWFPLFVAFTLCALVIYRRRRPGVWETWVWRVTLTGYLLACAATFLDYWTQWAGDYNVLFEVGWIVTVPALLLTLAGSTVLGVTLLVRRSAMRLPALLLALVIPLALLITQVTSLGNAVLPVMFAFGIAGRRLASGSATPEPVPTAEPRAAP
jgi:hypothetical protein